MKRTLFLTFMMLAIFVVSCQKKSIVPETENEITTFGQIYALLTNDITEIPKLKSKIIAQYPNKNTNGEIIELFKLYGY
ncbi:hypothetical protein CHU00_11860 [Sphingobacterium cellulitidis]|uniref:hypothetical protein n=1 Tax=Sphingobacterium cellulitidis TaxID=1768011 RepID=UPI000B942182|nr:hypothetical protein [Sphingobacterium cellulitidis]OYD45335.1 hypothetical protein CHU00_11860 [Sphingobacterium cellulitidis]